MRVLFVACTALLLGAALAIPAVPQPGVQPMGATVVAAESYTVLNRSGESALYSVDAHDGYSDPILLLDLRGGSAEQQGFDYGALVGHK